MKKTTTTTAAICGSLLGLALALPAQAQTYRYDAPVIGPESSPPSTRALVIIEEPAPVVEPQSATSRDNEGRPTHGALGTGDIDREMAMTRDYSYPERSRRFERY